MVVAVVVDDAVTNAVDTVPPSVEDDRFFGLIERVNEADALPNEFQLIYEIA